MRNFWLISKLCRPVHTSPGFPCHLYSPVNLQLIMVKCLKLTLSLEGQQNLKILLNMEWKVNEILIVCSFTLRSSISSFVGQNFIRFSTWSISNIDSSIARTAACKYHVFISKSIKTVLINEINVIITARTSKMPDLTIMSESGILTFVSIISVLFALRRSIYNWQQEASFGIY